MKPTRLIEVEDGKWADVDLSEETIKGMDWVKKLHAEPVDFAAGPIFTDDFFLTPLIIREKQKSAKEKRRDAKLKRQMKKLQERL